MDEQDIFLAAIEKNSPAERTAWLNETCGDDAALRQRIVTLIERYNDAGSFLERPPSELEATAMGVDDTHEDRDPDSNARTTLYDGSGGDVSLDFLHPSDKPGCLGTIGQYEVQSIIGRGGMGVVLKAHDTSLHRTVAVKVLAPELAANPTARQRFIREARAAAAVTNPHVVTTHAVAEDRIPYLVMELVDGKTLKEKIDADGMLSVKEILRIGSQIAHGLAAAHKQGLIHRDIKPGNILLENGIERVKITDFGLARAVDDMSVTRTGEVAGTPQYMSPEQAQGEGVDHRSDLFSLGSVMYSMCTGRPPFRGDNAMAVLRRVIDEPPRPIREVNAEIPDWLCDIVNKLLEKKPEDRYQTAKEVAGVLEESLANLQYPSHALTAPVMSQSPTSANEGSRPFTNRSLLVAAGVVGVLVLATGIIIKITQPDGTTIEIDAERGSRIEISDDDDAGGDISTTDGQKSSPVDFNGVWDSGWGEVTMRHTPVEGIDRVRLHGEYQFGIGSELNGYIDPTTRTFKGRFIEINTEGRIWLELSDDGLSIVGWYDYEDEPLGDIRPTIPWDMALITRLAPLDADEQPGIAVADAASSSAEILMSPDWEWTEAENLGPIVNTSSNEGGPTMTADGLTLMFHSDRAGGFGDNDLWMSTRPTLDTVWQPPVNLGPTINTESYEDNPSLSGDGLILVFQTSHDANGRSDLVMATRESQAAPWSVPVNLGDQIDSSADVAGTALSADGLALVFSSDTNGEYELFSTSRPALDAPWEPAQNLGPLINSPAAQGFATIASDGLSLIFNSNRSGGSPFGPIWIATRQTTSDDWSAPVRLQPEEQKGAWSPCLSGDSTLMLFDSRRAGGQGNGDFDIWMTRRVPRNAIASEEPPVEVSPSIPSAEILTSDDWEWSQPENLGPAINTESGEGSATLSADGLTLVFESDRADGFGGTDLWASFRDSMDSDWSPRVNLGRTVNTESHEGNPSLSADGLTLVFASNRTGGFGETDLWMTTRSSAEEPWSAPSNLGEYVNTAHSEFGAALSVDGLSLLLTSTREGEPELWESTRPTTDVPWYPPRRLGIQAVGGSALASDGLSLIYNASFSGGITGDTPLWIATRASTDSDWTTPELPLPYYPLEIHTSPCLSHDYRQMLFTAYRAGGHGDYDIWMIRRVRRVEEQGDATMPPTVSWPRS